MKELFVGQIADRAEVESQFLLRGLNLAVAKNGKPYLILKLVDRTGEIEGRVWDNADELAAQCAPDDFVQIKGRASLYMGKMQVVIKQMRRLDPASVDLADFLPVCPAPRDELEARLRQKVASIESAHFRALLEALLDRSDVLGGYCSAPAAKTMHHVYLGGLLEHSLAVADLADDIARRYAGLNRDLLVTAALLHDIGKIRELKYSRSFEYTDEGKLLGHIMLGVQIIDELLASLDSFPEQDAMLLRHLLLSHHGQYEYGSPKRPKTLEALILSYVDDLDSKINGVQTHFEREQHSDSSWSSYHRFYDRYFYKGERSDAPAEVETKAPAAPPAGAETSPRQRREQPLGATLADRLNAVNIDPDRLGSQGEKDED